MGDELAFGTGQVDGFAVGAHGDEPDEAGFGEADGVLADSGDIELFRVGVEEGHGWGVDPWAERGARLAICC